jgi:hypothetical protein
MHAMHRHFKLYLARSDGGIHCVARGFGMPTNLG